MVTPDGSSIVSVAQYQDRVETFSLSDEGEPTPVDSVASVNQPAILQIIGRA